MIRFRITFIRDAQGQNFESQMIWEQENQRVQTGRSKFVMVYKTLYRKRMIW